MQIINKPIPCEWEGCRSNASIQVFNSTMSESAFLCSFHRRVAAINLEQYDKIRITKEMKSPEKEKRPGVPIRSVIPDILKGKKKQPGVEDWEKKAAQSAEANAVPIEPLMTDDGEIEPIPDKIVIKPLITDIPTRRRE